MPRETKTPIEIVEDAKSLHASTINSIAETEDVLSRYYQRKISKDAIPQSKSREVQNTLDKLRNDYVRLDLLELVLYKK